MTETADKYRERAAAMTAKIEAVPDDAWANQSPCAEWTARDVVAHLVDTSGRFFGFIGKTPPDGPRVEVDPVAAWRAARDAMQAALDDPDVAATEFTGRFGPTTFAASVDRFVCTDLVVHNWDLSRATGQDEALDPQAMREIQADLASFGDAVRSSGAFGPEVEPPEDADDQTRFLCFLGRRP
ncbi:MAG: TIGR03086 family protein [Actinobacteria bacterium]|nr:TIGR03086 family protein [Actinomycetota bacterium]